MANKQDIEENRLGTIWWNSWLVMGLQQKQLEQGIVYANQGGVYDWSIDENGQVSGTVLGKGEESYQQQLLFEPLSDERKEALVHLLLERKSLLIQLLNHKLPAEILPLLQPILEWKDWEHVKMACSCSQWKLPCRHLSAVLYTIVNQINQEPLLLFRVLGINVLEELNRSDALLEEENKLTIPSWDDFQLLDNTNCSYDSAVKVDLSGISLSDDLFWDFLETEPSFYNGNWTTLLQQKLRKAKRYYQEQVVDSDMYTSFHQRLKNTSDVTLVINEKHEFLNCFVLEEGNSRPLFAQDQALAKSIGLLESVEIQDLNRYPDTFIAWHAAYRLVIKLLSQHWLTPRLIKGNNAYIIQWIPARSFNEVVASIIDQFKANFPTDLIVLDRSPLTKLSIEEQLNSWCTLVVKYYLSNASIQGKHNTQKDQLLDLFCANSTLLTNQTTAHAIHVWLQPFFIAKAAYAPIIKVVEVNSEPLTFGCQILVKTAKNTPQDALPLDHFLAQESNTKNQFNILKTLDQLVRFFPDLSTIIEGKNTLLQYTAAEFEQVFFEVLPSLKMLQIDVLLPQKLKRLTQPRLAVQVQKKGKGGKPSFMNLKNMLELQWQVKVGEELLEVMAFLELIKSKKGFVKHKEQYIYLEQAALEQIILELQQPPTATANEVVQLALSQRFKGKAVYLDDGVQALLKAYNETTLVPPPKTLKATLRPYQHKGYSWMYKNVQMGLGALIADDMGLGKTLQVISLLLKFKEEGYFESQQALIVVPTSLLSNWLQELQKFAPLLNASLYHGAKRILDQDADLIITTYGLARIDLTMINQMSWYCLVIDEAQAIKNVQTAQTSAIKNIKATVNIAMSGTPVENRLSEYWSIMDFVNPNYLGNLDTFVSNYSQPIEEDNDQNKLTDFRKITAPFILRRLKSDRSIIQDLPDKIEQNCYATIQQEQAAIYQQIVQNTMCDLAKYKGDKKKRQGLILKLMGGLKQVCNHPHQYLRTGRKGPECSGKGQVLMDLLTRIQHQGEKTLIFTQYRKMGNLMIAWIKERFGFEPMYLHGGCTRLERDAMVKAFQENRQKTIFILSLKAAGTGLNLTAANHVVHYDLWWNPAVEAQATDRAYRIGQQKNVQVYRFITKSTVEEKIDAMIQSKKNLANLTVSIGDQWLGDLSDDDLFHLLSINENP